jgi:gliding motility-associated-like protein
MNKYSIPFLVLGILSFGKILAQPEPCINPPTMTSFCEDACIICDIDGFEGRHESSISGLAPLDFCTIVQHNVQWIGFIAGSENLEINLAVSNCVQGPGLEIGIYEGINCENYQQVSQCWGAGTAVSEGTSKNFSNTIPLVIGQYYYLVMDGAFGDNCDWKFTVVSGSTQVAPLISSGNIIGDETVCPDFPFIYNLNAPSGATEFEWTVNGSVINTTTDSIEYTFPNDGNYTICVTARNACDVAPPSCTVIQVNSVPDTELINFLCEGDSFLVANTVIYEGGFFQFNLQNFEGCDSVVLVDLTEIVTPVLDIDVDICDGDSLLIGSTPFTQTGTYQEVLTSVFGCDSIINLDLFTIFCNITSDDTFTPPICFGENSGSIIFNVVSGTPPFSFTWTELNNTASGAGNIALVGELVSIDNLPKGTYLITILDNFGNSDIIISEITEPTEMSLEFVASDFNGFNVSCENSFNGNLQVLPSGGVSDYSFTWPSNQTTDLISNLTSGNYSVTVTDLSGCSLIGNFEMIAPTALNLIGDFSNPICDGPSTGSINIVQYSGGIAPYTFSLDGNNFTSGLLFENLTEGIYELQMMDANGCVFSITETLVSPQIPTIDLGENVVINLGETYTFQTTFNNINLQEISWTPSNSFDCSDCLSPTFLPLNDGNYTLFVSSEDDCTTTDSITITVNKFRHFFAPNAFSPNFDGHNDYFNLHGGSEVELIKKLTVFNRWGAVVFNGIDLESSVDLQGWDGTFNGKPVNPGVYVWVAEIQFLDGEVISYSGDLTITK